MALRDGIQQSWWGRILAEHHTEPAELWGGALKVLLGVQLLLPWQTFMMSVTFEDLAIIPEWIWAVFLMLAGIGHLAALRDGHRPWRRAACGIGFLVWFVFAGTFALSNPAGVGWVVFFMFALAQGWAYIRLRPPVVVPSA